MMSFPFLYMAFHCPRLSLVRGSVEELWWSDLLVGNAWGGGVCCLNQRCFVNKRKMWFPASGLSAVAWFMPKSSYWREPASNTFCKLRNPSNFSYPLVSVIQSMNSNSNLKIWKSLPHSTTFTAKLRQPSSLRDEFLVPSRASSLGRLCAFNNYIIIIIVTSFYVSRNPVGSSGSVSSGIVP